MFFLTFDLRDLSNLCRFFVFPCGAYLRIAFTSGSAVSGETDALDTYAVNDVTMAISMVAGFYHGSVI